MRLVFLYLWVINGLCLISVQGGSVFIKNNFRKNHLAPHLGVWNFNVFGDCRSVMMHRSISDCTMIKEPVWDFEVVIYHRDILGDTCGWREAQSRSYLDEGPAWNQLLKYVLKSSKKIELSCLISSMHVNYTHRMKNNNTSERCTDGPIVYTTLTLVCAETERPFCTVNPLVADVQLDTWLQAWCFNHSLSECAFTGQKMNHWFNLKKK